jgi:hypothetical protein
VCVVRRPLTLAPGVLPSVAELHGLMRDATDRVTPALGRAPQARRVHDAVRALDAALGRDDSTARCRAFQAAAIAFGLLPSDSSTARPRMALALILDLTAAALSTDTIRRH